MEDIDWARTRVYSSGNFGQLYINLKGREPNGIVSKEDAEQLIGELMIELGKLNDPKTGKKMFDNIYKSADIFNGSTDSPDIVFFDDEMKYSAHRMFELGSNKLITPHPIYSGNHKMDGILFAAGRGIKAMAEAPSAEPQLVDLAPTILHCLGNYIPNDTDGRVLQEIFDSTSKFANRRIGFSLEVELETLKVKQGARKLNTLRLFSRKDQESVEQRLRDLGYL